MGERHQQPHVLDDGTRVVPAAPYESIADAALFLPPAGGRQENFTPTAGMGAEEAKRALSEIHEINGGGVGGTAVGGKQ